MGGLYLDDVLLSSGASKEPAATAGVADHAKWARANKVTHSYIMGSLPVELHDTCAQELDAAKLWKHLEDRFSGQNLTSASALWVRLFALRLDDFGGVAGYLTALHKLGLELTKAGRTVDPTILPGAMLVAMGDRYPATREALLAAPVAEQTATIFGNRLLEAEKNAKVSAELNALTMGGGRGPASNSEAAAAFTQHPPCKYIRKYQGRFPDQTAGSACNRKHPKNLECYAKKDDAWMTANPGKPPHQIPNWRLIGAGAKPGQAGAGGQASQVARVLVSNAPVHVAPGAPSVNGVGGEGHFLNYLGPHDPSRGDPTCTSSFSAQAHVTVALDSGATTSCFRDGTGFQPLAEPVTVSGALPGLTSVARGTTCIPCPAVPSGQLRGLHHPDFRHNLVSVSELQQQGVDVLFPAGTKQALCKNPKTGAVVWSFHQGQLGLYEAKLRQQALTTTSLSNSPLHPTVLLHRQLGHIGESSLKALIRHQSIIGLPASYIPPPIPFPSSCLPCIQTKSQSQPHPPVNVRAEQILDKVHCDLVGPLPLGLKGHRYWLTLVDDHSRLGWSVPLHTKDQAKHRIIEWQVAAERQTGGKLKQFHSDRGGEFLNSVLLSHFRAQGVHCTFSNPHSPEQNGVAEARNKQVTRFTKLLLLNSGAPQSYWSYAVQHATLLNNLLPHGLLGGSTPYEAWHKAKPNLRRLRVWGCTGHVLLNSAERRQAGGKLGPVTKACILVGLNPAGPGWLLLDSTTHREIPSSDVVFQEHQPFFLRSKSPQPEDLVELPSNPSPAAAAAPHPPPSPAPSFSAGLSMRHSSADSEEEEGSVDSSMDSSRGAGVQGGAGVPVEPPLPRRASRPPPFYNPGSGQWTQGPQGPLLDKGSLRPLPPAAPPIPEEQVLPQQELGTVTATPVAQVPAPSTGIPRTAVVLLQQVVAGDSGDKHKELPTPDTWQEALNGENPEDWMESMAKEVEGLRETGTFKEVPRSEARNILGNKWVFRTKRRPDGTPLFKSRLTAKGFLQKQGVDYFETYAPTAKQVTGRLLLHLAAVLGYHAHVMDVDQAFLHGDLEEDIYMEPPPGLSKKAGIVWKLLRPLYGLKQAPRQWHAKLKEVLGKIGFKPCKSDPSLFMYQDSDGFWILVYVDDMLLVCKSTELLEKFKQQLKTYFPMKDLGEVHQYLGMEVTRDWAKHEIYLSQAEYVEDMLKKFAQEDAKEYNTPLQVNHNLTVAQEGDEQHPDQDRYPELVGSIMYLMVCSRPDIAHAVSALSRFVAPGRHAATHWKAALRLLGYLKATAQYKLVLGGSSSELVGYSDSSWADDQPGRKSSQGHCFMLGSGVISWKATRSPSVSLSICEAELYAACSASQEAVWLAELLTTMGHGPTSPPMLWCDNESTVALTKDAIFSGRSKHIEARYYFIRELVQAKRIQTAHIPGVDNPADIFTKALSAEDHSRLRDMLGVKLV